MQALKAKPLGVSRLAARPALKARSSASRRAQPIVCNAAATANNIPNAPVPWYDEHRQLPSYRSVFDFKFWVNHRNPLRYFTRSFDIHQSQVLRNVMPAVLWVMGVGAAFAAYALLGGAGNLPAWAPTAVDVSRFAQAFVTHTTIAMSLLLVFRTNQSYNRWDEARKFWGATLNRSRDIARQVVTCFPDTDNSAKQAFVRWHISFVKAMHRHFQNEGNLENDLRNVLPEPELKMLLGSQHRPMKALHVMGEIIMQVPMSPIHQQQISLNLQHFHDQLGASERLLRTPIPISYTRHTSRFLFTWLTFLPIALYSTLGWVTVPVSALISIALLKIDEIGVQIEEPFSILPLETIAGRMITDITATLKDDMEVKHTVRIGTMVSPVPYSNGVLATA